jgi:RHH-type transcriptional regulator, proline utilization regulon repressor / proline dehydrogenase / delta 1-pyrroline-5-carboxylate dehydrogenase
MTTELEQAIRRTGLWLYQLVEKETPSVFQEEYWMGRVLDWCMRDESIKVQMFRFIDVFPCLSRPESIARHFQEYFGQSRVPLPAALQWSIRFLSPDSFAAKTAARSLAGNLTHTAAHFIAGATPEEALPVFERLRSDGMAFTVDLLGEAVVSEEEASDYQARYMSLLDTLHGAQKGWPALQSHAEGLDWGHSPKINISIKTSAMHSQMAPVSFDHSIGVARERLVPVFQKAVQTGAFVALDMEQHSIKNLTLALYRSLMKEPWLTDYPHTGIVIQAYLRDSEHDLNGIIQWAKTHKRKLTIRLVKGAYWDSEVIWAGTNNWRAPVFTNKLQTDANFERLAHIILENHQWVRLACASHNFRSIACVMETAKMLRAPEDSVEYQVLYGMGEPVRNALRKAGLPLRVYTPVGEMIQGMAYLVRRLLENTANESFLRKSFAESLPREDLLQNPAQLFQLLEVHEEHTTSHDPCEERESFSLGSEMSPFEAEPSQKAFKNEPCWDWSRSNNREAFRDALARVRSRLPYRAHLSIGGKKVKSARVITSSNPNSLHEIVGEVSAGGRDEAQRAVEAARNAFPSWRETPANFRAEALFKAAAAARKLRHDLAALEVFEVGKSWGEADADVCEAIDFLEYYGREMIRLGVPRPMGDAPGEASHLFYEPRGVAVVIAPWNFPLAISMGMVSAAIVAGNTVVYKPASQSPVTGSMVLRIFEEAKLPPGVLNFLPGPGGELGDTLVTHPDVALIVFTGSREVGLRIVELAAKTVAGAGCIKNVIVEMGGKNAIIVDADAELDEAIPHILHSAFGYQGQKCSACSRLIVLEEHHDRLLTRLQSAARSLNLGPTEDPKSFMGAVIDASAREKIERYIDMGRQEGRLVLERHFGDSDGHFVPLCIFADMRPEHRLAQEEIFGPVLSVIKVRDIREAIEVANGTPYALTGALFSRSPANIEKVSRELRVGNLYINRGCTGAIVGRHPFGGFKFSGVGSKAGGPDYLLQFMVPRNLVENTMRRGFAPVRAKKKTLGK